MTTNARPTAQDLRRPIKIGIVGLGKISRDQHLPVIASNSDFEIAFLADKMVRSSIEAPHYSSLESALNSGIAFDAVALCTSPQPRFELCEKLFNFDCSILLEKPAAATFDQAQTILTQSKSSQSTIFAAWHSQFSPQISAARTWMKTRKLSRGRVEWRENAAKWHPGQDWLWREGGYGVFDPGMNALSILTELIPLHLHVEYGQLTIPENASTPSLADFRLLANDAPIDVSFEFHQHESEKWNILLEATDGSQMKLKKGGAELTIDAGQSVASEPAEYEAVYAYFADLVRRRKSDFDIEPLRIADDVFRIAESVTGPAVVI